MNNIYRFRPKNGTRVVFRGRQRASGKHRITISVLDKLDPEDVRALAQRRIVHAASFKALRGFTDDAARRSREHSFVASRGNTARFVREIHPLLRDGLVAISIDGLALRNGGLVSVA